MEKFGLFNLLSALISASGSEAKTEGREERAAENKTPAAPPAGVFTPEQRAARCSQILERHERISRDIDRKNRS